MHIEVFSFCDAATGERGKLNILGAFDTIWSEKLPRVHPQCAIALRIRFNSIEKGEHKVRVNIIDLDGKHVIPPLEGKINIGFSDEQRSLSVNLIMNIHRLKFEKYGEHSIDLAIDGRQEASLPLFIREIVKKL